MLRDVFGARPETLTSRVTTMNFQIDISSSCKPVPAVEPPPASPATETNELLKQLIEVAREQLAYQRAAVAAHDMTARWRAYLSRWQHEFPGLSENCRKAMPALERCYGQLITDLTERLNEEEGGIDTDFALQEFLDRYGMRLAQLGTILNLVAPLAEAGPQGESA
jgi:hypothetical protein